jgi:hypothetical protein
MARALWPAWMGVPIADVFALLIRGFIRPFNLSFLEVIVRLENGPAVSCQRPGTDHAGNDPTLRFYPSPQKDSAGFARKVACGFDDHSVQNALGDANQLCRSLHLG